jgi:hypothetical protein
MYVSVDQTSGDLTNLVSGGVNGTLSGATYATDATYGNVVDFDGTGDRVSFGTGFQSYNQNEWSAGCVFKTNPAGTTFLMGEGAASQYVWGLRVNANNTLIVFRFTKVGASTLSATTTATFIDDEWTGCVITMNEVAGSEELSLYLGAAEAVIDNTLSTAPIPPTVPPPLTLGERGDGWGDFTGQIKYAFLADTILTAAQAAAWIADPTSPLLGSGLQTNQAITAPRNYIYTTPHNGIRENQVFDEIAGKR